MIKLGEEVKDTITGFRGIAVSRVEWLNGCVRYAIQGKVNADGKVPKEEWFDETQLEVVKKKNVKDRKRLGGPTPAPKRNPDPIR